ncbi:MAG: hypothetical protein GYB35_17165 [Algicola sp.]|nr:hypothetical protein [Algicola sp.]
MTRSFILIISILSFSFSYGQYNWKSGKLILKNGDTLKGLIKIPMASGNLIAISKSNLEYKKDKKGKKKNFDKTEIDKVFFITSYNPNIGYYEYVPISNNGAFLFKLIRNGKAKLYVRTIKKSISNGTHYVNDTWQNQNKNVKIKEYYIIRENETIATKIIRPDNLDFPEEGILKKYKESLLKYFSDCEEVVSFIDDDLYEDYDIGQIVEDYNLICE